MHMRSLPLAIIVVALVTALPAAALETVRKPASSTRSSAQSRITAVTCIKTMVGGCAAFSCSDTTTYSVCDKVSAVRSSAPASIIRKKNLTTALAKKLQSTSKASMSSSAGVPYSCNTEMKEGGCYFVYCGKEKKADLLTVACPQLSYGASFFSGATCTYSVVEYASKYGSNKTGLCSITCDKDEFPGLPIGYKKNMAKNVDCPVWMHVPEAAPTPGANDQYCKQHPEDTFICSPSAG